MSSSAAAAVRKQPRVSSTRPRSLGLVLGCTFINAAAQVLFKTGSRHLSLDPILLLTNIALWGGLSLLGISTVALVYALRDGELSLLYPVIALTYVWVTALSFLLFHETVSGYKLIGISAILVGVVVLGKGR